MFVKQEIRILMLEDSSDDACLMSRELRKSGLVFQSKRVETREEFLAELGQQPPDLILLDHGLPAFDGFTALAIAREKLPDVPLIFVTGLLGEEMVLKTLKSGATDYVLKHHLSDLVPAVHRALRHAEERAGRRAAEAAWRRSEERFRLLVENVTDYAIYMLDPEGRITTWNAGAERIEGYPAEEIIGQPISVLHLPEDSAAGKPAQMLQTARAAGRFQEEGWRVRKDGTRFWASVVITPLWNEAGQLTGFAKVSRDMTELKRVADALRHSEERYRRLVELCPDALLVLCGERIVFVNTAAVRLLGAGCPEELMGRPLKEIIHPDYWPTVQQRLQRLQENEFNPFMEQQVVRFDGRVVDVEAASTALKFQDQAAVQIILHDITEHKHAQEQIRRLNTDLETRVVQRTAQLEAANKELEAFSYSVSHDLRAPLRHIDGFVQILRSHLEENLDEQGRSALKTISDAARKMGRLIEDLLAFSRMNRAELRHKPVKLAALVEKARAELEVDCKGRQIAWTIGPLPEVRGDPDMLRQALINLISNAVKYSRTRAEARIEIGSRETESETICFVRDNGVGFDPEYAQKLFGVFQRLHSPEDFEGTGIGLAIVRRVIARHGGRTWAESAVDQGATFYFSLPRRPQA